MSQTALRNSHGIESYFVDEARRQCKVFSGGYQPYGILASVGTSSFLRASHALTPHTVHAFQIKNGYYVPPTSVAISCIPSPVEHKRFHTTFGAPNQDLVQHPRSLNILFVAHSAHFLNAAVSLRFRDKK